MPTSARSAPGTWAIRYFPGVAEIQSSAERRSMLQDLELVLVSMAALSRTLKTGLEVWSNRSIRPARPARRCS